MRFWTIQPLVVWQRMESRESVHVDPDNPKYEGQRPWQYERLSAGLHRNHPGFDGGWPWWLACREPDLDHCRSRAHPGGRQKTIIGLDLPEDRYVIFPLWMWETIHTGTFLADSRKELDAWHHNLSAAVADPDDRPLPEPWQARLEASWERIFRPNRHPRFWYRDQEPRDDGTDLSRLMREASEELVGLTQVLRSADVATVVPFDSAG